MIAYICESCRRLEHNCTYEGCECCGSSDPTWEEIKEAREECATPGWYDDDERSQALDELVREGQERGEYSLHQCPACGARGYHEWNCPLNKPNSSLHVASRRAARHYALADLPANVAQCGALQSRHAGDDLNNERCTTCNGLGSVRDSEVPYLGHACPDCT